MTKPTKITDQINDVSRKQESEHFTDFLPFLLAKASYLVRQGILEYFNDYDVPMPISTWRILTRINEGSERVGDLAKLVMMNQPTLSKALNRLEADGLIEKCRDKSNRRTVYISITTKGKKMVADLIPKVRAHEHLVFADYDQQQLDEVRDFLRRLITKLERHDR